MCRSALATLRPLVPPRVLAAVWRTQWNGWTRRRMNTRGGGVAGGRCMLGCHGEDHDSVEHYARCPLLRGWASRALRLAAPPVEARLGDFLLLTPRPRADAGGELPRRALRTAAAYRVHCLVRHGRVARGPAACEALSQVARDMVRGHALAGAALDAAEMAAWEFRGPGGAAAAAAGG